MNEKQLATFKIDGDEWQAFKARARTQGTNASALIKRFIQLYMDGEIKFDSAHQLEQLLQHAEVLQRIATLEQRMDITPVEKDAYG